MPSWTYPHPRLQDAADDLEMQHRLAAFGQPDDGEPPRAPRRSTSSHTRPEQEEPEPRRRPKNGPVVTL
eukprot:7219972-Pyramimonas_sp.AAC.1